MKVSKRTKYVLAAPLFVVASLALQFSTALPTYAATLIWTGAGDGTSFSDGDNWNTNSAPVDNDVLTFDVTGVTEQETLNNDISGLSVSGISFAGTTGGYFSYTLQGNDLTLTGDITNSITGAEANFAIPTIQNNITLGADVSATKVQLGVNGSTLNLGSHNLSFAGVADTCGVNIFSNLSGTGALNVSGPAVNIRGNSASYAGPIAVTGDVNFGPTSFGTNAAGTTVSGAGTLRVVHSENSIVSEPFTLGGSGAFGSVQSYYGCSGGNGPVATLTLNGPVTLTSDFRYSGSNNTVITGTYTNNGHSFTVAGGTTGTLTTPQGEETAPTETVELNGDETGFTQIGNKQTGILNGTREYITVTPGGVLKGTGTTDQLSVNEGAIVNPGNSPGTLTVLDSFTLGGTYQAELLNKDTYDQLLVGEDYILSGNAVALYSGATLETILFDGWSIAQGDAFTIIDNRSSTEVQGTFDGLDEGAQLVVDGITFSITYVGGDGNDVVLTALNAGTDPSAPNTGVAGFVQANPVVVAGFGIVAAGMLLAIAIRRRNTQ